MRTKTVLIGFLIMIAIIVVFYIKNLKSSLDYTLTELATVNASNASLKLAGSLNSAFTRQQLEYEIQQREKSDATISKLQKSLHGNQCASSRMPDDVINSLRTPNSS